MPTNTDRAEWARQSIALFAKNTGLDFAGEDLETQVSDFLADLMHLCDVEGVDVATCWDRGLSHYVEERRCADVDGDC